MSVPTPGSRPPTQADVARHAGVSKALVSIVLRGVEGASEATRARVREAAVELGYRPDSRAQSLRSSRSRNLGVLFSLRNSFSVDMVEHMYPVARELGYHLVLGPFGASRSQEMVVEELLRARCEGIIVVGSEMHGRSLEAVAHDIALVDVCRGVAKGRVDVIRNDDAVGIRQAVDHLVDLGHRAIAYIDGGDNGDAEDRRAGYRAAMADHALDAHLRIIPGGYTEDAGAVAARELLGPGSPTAVIAANDPCAIGVLDTLIRAGIRIPQQMSVIGYDDSLFSRLPGIDLTTVHQNIARMAKHAVRAAVDRLDGPPRKARDVAIRPRLAVRGTTAPPRTATSTAAVPRVGSQQP